MSSTDGRVSRSDGDTTSGCEQTNGNTTLSPNAQNLIQRTLIDVGDRQNDGLVEYRVQSSGDRICLINVT